MSCTLARISFLFGLLLLLVMAPAVSTSSMAQKTATLVLVVSRSDPQEARSSMDAVVMIEDGKLKAPYSEESEAAQQKFASEYFAPGKKYHVTFGGGEVGTATVKGSQVGCNNIHASALVEHNGRVPAHLSALATNSQSLGRKPGSRRAPTNAERSAVMKLVNQIYRSRGTTPGAIRTLKTTNLTATDLDADGRFELIGSFVIETKTPRTSARRDLLLIAEPQGTTYKAAFVNFQSYKLPPEGFDSAIDFVDQLDLDGDGVGEVFVTQHGFDAYGYSIYKRVNRRWGKVYTAIGDAC